MANPDSIRLEWVTGLGVLLLAACAPPAIVDDDANDEAEDSSGDDAIACSDVVAETCGPLPCVVQQAVDLSNPDHVSHDRPTLVVGSNCQPHALIPGNQTFAPGWAPLYATTHDGVTWTQEELPLYSAHGSLFVDPIDDTPVVFGELVGDFQSYELRDGAWQPAGFEGPGELEAAVRTHDGVTHVLAKVTSEHTLYSFTSPGEFSTMVIGVDGSEAVSRLVTDRVREQLQTTHWDNLAPKWWSWTTGSQAMIDVGRPTALTAAGEPASPRAYALDEDEDLWFVSRSAEATWSRRWITDGDDWGVFPDDPIEGQIFVRHVREVEGIATVVDLDGQPRWIWSQIDWVEHWASVDGAWVEQSFEPGAAALHLGWLEDGEPASRLLDDQLAARMGDAVVDASGTLHLLVLVGPPSHGPYDLWPVYLRLGIG